MPIKLEVPVPLAKLVQEVRNTQQGDLVSRHQQVAKIVAEEADVKQRYVGHGGETIVISDRERPDIVHAIDYELHDGEDRRRLFYTQRVMSTLFPNTFPRFLSAWGPDDGVVNTEGMYSGSVRERLTIANEGTPVNDEEYRRKKRFYEAVCFLPLGLETEAGKNLIVGNDGYIKYVDRIFIYDTIKDSQVQKLATYMDHEQVRDKVNQELRPYTQQEKDMVQKALLRLQELQRQGRGSSGALEELYRLGQDQDNGGEDYEVRESKKGMRLVSNKGWKARIQEVPQDGERLMWWSLYYAPINELSGITIGSAHFDIITQNGKYILQNTKTGEKFALQNGRGWQFGNFSNEKYGHRFKMPRMKIEGEGTDDLQAALVIYKDQLFITDTSSGEPTIVQRKQK